MITKLDYQAYSISSLAHKIFLNVGETSVDVVVTIYKDAYTHFWQCTGKNPIEFLQQMDVHYFWKKLANNEHLCVDYDRCQLQLKHAILLARKKKHLTASDARSAWTEMLELNNHNSHATLDEYNRVLSAHYLSYDIFVDADDYPSAEIIKPELQRYFTDVWQPFIGYIYRQSHHNEISI